MQNEIFNIIFNIMKISNLKSYSFIDCFGAKVMHARYIRDANLTSISDNVLKNQKSLLLNTND